MRRRLFTFFPLRRAFSLIEILVVVAILVILIGIVLLIAISGAKAGVTHTKTTLAALSPVMSHYLKSHPEPAANIWLPALKADPSTASVISTLPQANLKVVDGFGNPIEYVPAHTAGNPSAYFRSAGPDGIIGNADDIMSAPVAP